MASALLKLTDVQIGQSLTATNNFTIYQPASPDGTVRWGVGNSGSVTDIVTLNSSGNVGIGTSSPHTIGLTVYKASGSSGIRYQSGVNSTDVVQAGSDLYVANNTSGTSQFWIGGTERMRIDSSGNVGIGTSSPSASAKLTLGRVDASYEGGQVDLCRSSDNAAAWSLDVYGNTSTPALRFIDVTASSERMRIDSGGIVYIGGTTGYGSAPTGLGVKSTTTNWQVISLAQPNASAGCVINYVTPSTTGVGWDAGAANGSSAWMFRYNASQISNINSSTGVYTATSDVNRKKDFEESKIGLAEVMRLKPTLFRMLVDDESAEKELGFIAQDVKSVIPQAYVEDGDFIGLQDRPIIAALTKAIQELTARVIELEKK